MNTSLFVYVILLPLAGFVLNGTLGMFNWLNWRHDSRKSLIGWLSSIIILIPFLIVFQLFLSMDGSEVAVVSLYKWFSIGDLSVDVAFQIDSLSILMGMMVTGVSFLIHVYSIGYMKHDEGFWRYFAYLNLFVFAMLVLIFSDNLVLMFLGWEGVGLCSYLLIGFWFKHAFVNDAAIKAFVMNRIGDFAFLLGIFLIFQTIGTVSFSGINENVSGFSDQTLFWAAILLFIGATGKSAQIPLYTWLPDAMAGPTPVSALIHAATMVTAGVYLLARMSPFYIASPDAMMVVAVIGGATALFAATIGLLQNDIKKVLAYSTVSQLGYMFLAAGVGAFGAAIFHVFTHAFFKACLFLGSGSVIHAMNEEQDIRHMGGLVKYLPHTFITFIVATFALSGFPLTAGFFSKDDILFQAFASGNITLWVVGLLGAVLTAVYMMRLVSLTFLGNYRGAKNHTPHESPMVMVIPLYILAGFSLLIGFIGMPAVLSEANWVKNWLGNSVIISDAHAAHSTEWILIAIGSSVAIGGLAIGWYFYTTGIQAVGALKTRFSGIYELVANKYYIDELYDKVITQPYRWMSDQIWAGIEARFCYPFLGWVGQFSNGIGEVSRFLQTGHTPAYVTLFIIGVIGIVSYLIL